MVSNEILFFTGFTVFIIAMLAMDLGLFSKKDHVVSFKEAAAWSAVWVLFALGFYIFLDLYGHLVHGIGNYDDLAHIVNKYMPNEVKLSPSNYELSLELYRDNLSLEFITGYLLEYSLSVDNIFVIIMIFNSFNVREKYYKKVLFWGILGAIVMRFIFIFLGAALIHEFHWIMYLFGAFLMYTGVKMFLDKGDEDEKIEPNKHPVVRFVARYFKLYPRYVHSHFFVKKNNLWHVTPLFLVVMIIEATDLVFAVDSVPAVFAVTEDPYIVFFSNIFAIMGLRSMFFFLSNIVGVFRYLKTGLAFLLVFIGFKMIAADWLKSVGFETSYSLYIILGILGLSILASVVIKPKAEPMAPREEKNRAHLEKV
ncbi:MAG: TerC family protein [Bernardetiaceae bacterium]|jgi:tellurite resistance protein TerC|nr:TerC family protein [Bernardetiaceae bacterium]